MKNKKHIIDITIILVLLAAALIGLLFLRPKQSGKYASVMVEGEEIARYPLSEEIETDISQNGTNRLVIKNGYASIESADCLNQICVKHEAINKLGETIVCLPNKLIIKITE